ncbi:hypothetical protein LSAT2_028768 [Lamellibrachia satsuma]|nr:hypothetical protein LSAT2_028768 [Lamellibrachia satsuma]
MAATEGRREVPFEDWRLWRTELNNGLVKKMFTGDLGQTCVPFEQYLQYPSDNNYAGSVALEQQANGLLVYSTGVNEQSGLPKKNFLNYGIPRVAMSPGDRRQPQTRRTDQATSSTQTSMFDVIGMTDGQTVIIPQHRQHPQDQQHPRKRLPRADGPMSGAFLGRQVSTKKKVRIDGEITNDSRAFREKLLRIPVPAEQLPRNPFEDMELQTTRDKHLPRFHDRQLPRTGPPGLPRTSIEHM